MIKTPLTLSAMFVISVAPIEAKAFPLKLGIVGYGDLIPLPAVVIGTEVLPNLRAEFMGATLLLAGAADLGLKFILPIKSELNATLGLRSGFNYSFSESSLYYASTIGSQYGKFDFDVGPTWYYRRDTEHSRNFKVKVNVFASLSYALLP